MDFTILPIILIVLVAIIGLLILKKVFGFILKAFLIIFILVLAASAVVFFDVKHTYDQYTNGATVVLVGTNGTLLKAYNFSNKAELNKAPFNTTFKEFVATNKTNPPANYTAIIIVERDAKLNFKDFFVPKGIYLNPQPKSYEWLDKIN